MTGESLYSETPYDYAALTPDGRLVLTAGACPLDEHGAVVAPGDVEQQAARAVDNLFAALEAAGSGREHVLKTTLYVASGDRRDLVRAWNVVERAFRPARPPSTLLGVSVLGYRDQLVEIEAVAAVATRT